MQSYELEIKKAAKQGNKQAATVLAKQLINMRKQRTKSYSVGSKIHSIGTQQKVMHSNMKMGTAMATTTKTMQQMNKVMDPVKTAKTMQDFTKESMKMEMSEEMINDTLDDILGESGDEEESDAIVSQVLDEIGIDMSGKLADAPIHRGKVGEASGSNAEADIERQLAALKDL
ncbi:charged multivesicular body protein 2b-like isoform X2 [Mizuhopecten yessoensis]|uniref:charged multivesicular body protein 2b-like isoform X2 n=1 Tax=Mizuhopecten yessoensis TaxID=6573 RepID=UPI000B45BAA6|nr:charged multivesicular body protein 2b-like isoform X2 [Mizuhopecten yessoensis]